MLEIVEKVKKGGWDPYRPQLPSQLLDMPELVGIMCECWAEAPQDRPSFEDLVKHFKQFNSGRSVQHSRCTCIIINAKRWILTQSKCIR